MKITISQIVASIFVVDLIASLVYPVTDSYVYFLGELICYFLYLLAMYRLGKFKFWMPYVVGVYAPLFFHFYKDWMIKMDAYIWLFAFIYLYSQVKNTKNASMAIMAIVFSGFNVMRQYGVGSWSGWTIESIVSMIMVVIGTYILYQYDKKRLSKNVHN